MTKSKSATKAAAKTPPLRLQIDNEVVRRIRQHARAHMKTEVCGVLIGEANNGQVEVQASIEGVMAAQAGTHVTFTQDAWEAIYKVKDVSYPDERIVGWYHSHPGFGVFLSEHDTFIHRNFFSSTDQVAWVYDPHTDEEGCFGWIDGEIHRVPSFAMIDNNGDGIERTPKDSDSHGIDPDDEMDWSSNERDRLAGPPAWLRWSVTALSYLSALAVGFLVAYFLFPLRIYIPVNPYTGEPLPTHSSTAPSAAPDAAAPTETPTQTHPAASPASGPASPPAPNVTQHAAPAAPNATPERKK